MPNRPANSPAHEASPAQEEEWDTWAENARQSVAENLPGLIEHVRLHVLPLYEELARTNPMTHLTVATIRHDLETATKALAEGDAATCFRLYVILKGTAEAVS